MSFNDTACHIDIYDAEWSYNPLTLKGAAEPFYYQDNDSDDLLNDVIRYRTGYIRIIDEDGAPTNGLFPTTIFERYVEVFYGTELAFNGYIQVQEFCDQLIPNPKVIELPVISPLGLFDKRKFQNTDFLPPTSVSLGQLLDMALVHDYSRLYLPNDNGSGSYGYPNNVSLAEKIHSLAISPWNKNFHHSQQSHMFYNMLSPLTYAELIEYICKAFGWVCHDMPGALVFTAFDYQGDYIYYPVGHIGDGDYRQNAGIPSSASALNGFFSLFDNAANMQTLFPDSGIEITYDGSLDKYQFSFARTTFHDVQRPDPAETREQWCFCNLTPVLGVGEISGVSPLSFVPGSSVIQSGKGCVAWNGKEGFLISISSSWNDQTSLFTIRYYRRKLTNVSYFFGYDIMTSPMFIGNLKSDPDFDNGYIQVSQTADTDDYLEYEFKYHFNGTTLPALADNYLIFIHSIYFDPLDNGDPYVKYSVRPAGDSDTIPEQDDLHNPVISSTVHMPISLYRLNDTLIGDSVLSTKITTYPYLFQPRKKLTSKFRIEAAATIPYARLFSYYGRKWRIVAQEFHPRDDEFLLTMQSSPVLT